MLEGLHRQCIARGDGCLAIILLQFRKHRGVIGAVDNDRDRRMILGGGAQQGWPADIDILDRHRQVAVITRHGLLKGIKVDHHHIDGPNTVLRHHRLIRPAARKNTAVNLRVQRLDAAGHHLRKTGVIRDLGDRDTRLRKQACRAARGENLDTQCMQVPGKIGDAGLVRNADQCALYFVHKVLWFLIEKL